MGMCRKGVIGLRIPPIHTLRLQVHLYADASSNKINRPIVLNIRIVPIIGATEY